MGMAERQSLRLLKYRMLTRRVPAGAALDVDQFGGSSRHLLLPEASKWQL